MLEDMMLIDADIDLDQELGILHDEHQHMHVHNARGELNSNDNALEIMHGIDFEFDEKT